MHEAVVGDVANHPEQLAGGDAADGDAGPRENHHHTQGALVSDQEGQAAEDADAENPEATTR